MPRLAPRLIALATTLAGAALLSACQSRLREAPDFGEAVRENQAAQIANPDAHYAGAPAPGSNGMRANSAQERYVRGKVTPPPATATTEIAGTAGGGATGGGASQ